MVAGMTLAERDMVQDPRIRRACEQENLAILFFKCGLGAVDLQNVLDDFSKLSGYDELSNAPLFFIGHSAGGPQAKTLAIKFAPRCFGLVQYRGGVPGGDESVPDGIPCLMMLGQFDEFGKTMRDDTGRETWEGGRDALVNFRQASPKHLASIIIEPGAGHFAWSDRTAAYLSLFIQKAARARIPNAPGEAGKPVMCKQINPETGWLSQVPAKAPTQPAPASYDRFEGDKSKAAWHFDEEIAKATAAYHAGLAGKQDQFIRWSDPTWVDAGVRNYLTDLKWIDTQSFEVHPHYADNYPKTSASAPGPHWAEAGKPLGHSPAAIQIRPVGGSPVIASGPATFRIQYSALAGADEGSRVTFLAFSPGDDQFRYTEQVGMMPRGFKGLTKGKEQTITFPNIGTLPVDGTSVALHATSDADLPIEYYVAYGPAIIENGKIRAAEIPARTRPPITAKVVAWQFGSARAPLVKGATPIDQNVLIRDR